MNLAVYKFSVPKKNTSYEDSSKLKDLYKNFYEYGELINKIILSCTLFKRKEVESGYTPKKSTKISYFLFLSCGATHSIGRVPKPHKCN